MGISSACTPEDLDSVLAQHRQRTSSCEAIHGIPVLVGPTPQRLLAATHERRACRAAIGCNPPSSPFDPPLARSLRLQSARNLAGPAWAGHRIFAA
ncbi:hypothetical protein PC116_g11205 [Phytophthora cactorum]|nr:hypothetical protein PC114_g2879 [Phytophthora cactorum]KAG3008189.1 hypothetical protein PC120_g16381 [Phytophthora cactorum]KAG4048046.1 hypothetical protein PC123_g16623 [Phytophthora cactorum]KAG4240857.1 hypothetical protein PC116_g11205 [Phytophthora cactorum]